MNSLKLKRARGLRNRSANLSSYIMTGLLLLSCIALVVTSVRMVRNGQRLTHVKDQLEQSIQGELNQVLRTYDEMKAPRANLGGALLPEMRKYLYSAYMQSNLLTDAYGQDQSIVNNELYTQVDGAIDAVMSGIEQGLIIDVTSEPLGAAMAQINEVMDQRFDAQTSLL